jgi:competence protein ComEC
VALAVVARRRRAIVALLALAASGSAGALALATRLEAAAQGRPAAPLEASFDATVSFAARVPGGVEVDVADAVAAPGVEARVPERIRLRERDAGAGPTPLGSVVSGDRIRVRARLRAPEGRANPGVRDRSRDLARRGIGASGAPSHPDLVVRLPDQEGARPLAWLHAFRAAASQRLLACGEGGALLAALALGDRGGLDAARREQFRRLGLTHLLSVSGLHLVLVGALLYGVARHALRPLSLVADRRRTALATAVLAATGYALLTGFEVPVRRSLVLIVALAASVWLRRPVRRGAPLALAALAILAFEPEALFDAGAQMSFLASGALIFGLRREQQAEVAARGGFRASLLDLLDTSALATAATAPVAAAVIGSVSPWGLVANLVAVPWTGFVLMPISLVAGLLAGATPDTDWIGLVLRALSAAGSFSLDALALVAAATPPSWPARPALPFVLAALAALGFVLRTTRVSSRIAWTLAILAALALAPPPRIEPLPPRVVHLDVGQGDATLVQGTRAAILVDAGTALPDGADMGASVVVPALHALGVRRLAVAVASHGDLDHRGGLASVLRAIPTERLWLPLGALREPAFAALAAEAHALGVRVEERGAGSPRESIGDLQVESLWPPPAAEAVRSRNDRSLTLRIEVAGRTLLLAGDLEATAEAALIARGAPLRAEVLKLSHHGSRTSSSAAFLDAVGGSVAVASAPRWSRFGMPHPDVADRVHGAGYALWWTGRDGAVLVGLVPRLWVRGWRDWR